MMSVVVLPGEELGEVTEGRSTFSGQSQLYRAYPLHVG